MITQLVPAPPDFYAVVSDPNEKGQYLAQVVYYFALDSTGNIHPMGIIYGFLDPLDDFVNHVGVYPKSDLGEFPGALRR